MMPIRVLIACLAVWCAVSAHGQAVAEDFPRALPPSMAWSERPIVFEPECTDCDPPMQGPEIWPADRRFPSDGWSLQVLPAGLIYRAYLASPIESRLASHWIGDQDGVSLWDIALGGHVGILRYGTDDPIWPEGWQIDVEGASLPRLTLDRFRDLVSVDFRFGVPITWRRGPWESKFAYFHLSSHLGDEFIAINGPAVSRINYSRDALVWGLGLRPNRDVRLYAEVEWAFYVSGGAEPWAFQFGAEYSPAEPTGIAGAPFLALNARIRQEVDFSGYVTVQTGWQWRGQTGKLFRIGLHYLNGKSNQFQFHTQHEEQFALAIWHDF